MSQEAPVEEKQKFEIMDEDHARGHWTRIQTRAEEHGISQEDLTEMANKAAKLFGRKPTREETDQTTKGLTNQEGIIFGSISQLLREMWEGVQEATLSRDTAANILEEVFGPEGMPENIKAKFGLEKVQQQNV